VTKYILFTKLLKYIKLIIDTCVIQRILENSTAHFGRISFTRGITVLVFQLTIFTVVQAAVAGRGGLDASVGKSDGFTFSDACSN
jgi:hypothetical protein